MLSRLRTWYRERRLFRWAVDLGAVLLVLALAGLWQTRSHLRGVEFPAFDLEQLGGGRATLQSLSGRPAMIALWAPWCGVCKAQADNVARVARWSTGRGQVVSIALAYESRADVERYAREEGAGVPVLLGTEALGRALRVDSFPTVYFVDAQGRITRSVVGYTTTLGLWWRLLIS